MLPTLEQVCAAVGYTPDQLRARDRHKTIADARRLAYLLLHRKAGHSLHEVGQALHRNHSTVHYGITSWEANYDVDHHVQEYTSRVLTKLNAMITA